MSYKTERHVDDRLGHPLDVPAEEFTAVPGTGEFPEWRADPSNEEGDDEDTANQISPPRR